MLFEIEQKVSYLSELSIHSESLLLEGRAETKGEAEQLTFKLRSLKDSLLELQQMLQDKQVDIQVRSGVMYALVLTCFMLSVLSLLIHVCTHFPCPSCPPSLSLCGFCCAVQHDVTLGKSINGGIV